MPLWHAACSTSLPSQRQPPEASYCCASDWVCRPTVRNSPSYCFEFVDVPNSDVLARLTTQGSQERVTLFQRTARLLSNASFEQIKHVKRCFAFVCRQFAEDACSLGLARAAVRPLQAVLGAAASSQWCLTTLHTDFLQVCLAAKAFKAASAVAAVDVYDVDGDERVFSAEDYARYWLYAGMVAIGLKQWARALEALRNCVTTPAMALSAVVVEAYKKFVLVSLISKGAVAELPKYTPAIVRNNSSTFASQYVLLADAFKRMDRPELLKVVKEGEDVFTEDGNFGLVKQAVASLARRKVQQLTHFYVTVSMSDVAKNVGLDSVATAEELLVDMINCGDVCASIDQRRSMVTFRDAPESYASPAALARLHAEVAAAMKLSERLRVHDEEMQADDQFVRRSILMEHRGSAGVGGAGIAGMPSGVMAALGGGGVAPV